MNLRLPTLNQFNQHLTLMAKLFDQVEHLQHQASTGKKLEKPSDDPLLAEKIQKTHLNLKTHEGYELNQTLAKDRVKLVENSLEHGKTELLRIQELIIEAKSDVLGSTERSLIAGEISSKLETLVGLANTKDAEGQYVFSGINAKNPAYEKKGDTYVYQGSEEVTQIALSPTFKITHNESGEKVFGHFKTENGDNLFNLLQRIVTCLNKPSDTPEDRAHFHQELNSLSDSLKQGIAHFQQYSMELSHRESLIESQDKLSSNQNLIEKESLSRLSDADMGQVISELTQQMSLLELTQQSYLKMQELFSNLYRIG